MIESATFVRLGIVSPTEEKKSDQNSMREKNECTLIEGMGRFGGIARRYSELSQREVIDIWA